MSNSWLIRKYKEGPSHCKHRNTYAREAILCRTTYCANLQWMASLASKWWSRQALFAYPAVAHCRSRKYTYCRNNSVFFILKAKISCSKQQWRCNNVTGESNILSFDLHHWLIKKGHRVMCGSKFTSFIAPICPYCLPLLILSLMNGIEPLNENDHCCSEFLDQKDPPFF